VKYRSLGATGLQVSELGFGCGSVGGLVVRGQPRSIVAAVGRAVELGVNYFDTAPAYGNGLSETNLGRSLNELKADVLVGTKVMLTPADLEDGIGAAVTASLEASLRRLRRERVDLLQLHNRIRSSHIMYRGEVSVTVSDVHAAVEAFHRLQEQGKIRFWGLNGIGDSPAILAAVGSAEAHSIQVCYNLLNPSAGMQAPPGFPFQDFQRLIDRAAERHMGVLAMRVLAAGALTGSAERHELASTGFIPIASGKDHADDVRRARLFRFLVDEGHTRSLVEAALRFALSKPQVSTALIGFSSLEQLEEAVECAERGPLPAEVLDRIAAVVSLQAQQEAEQTDTRTKD